MKKDKKKNDDVTYIILIVDKSSSMHIEVEDEIGFNTPFSYRRHVMG